MRSHDANVRWVRCTHGERGSIPGRAVGPRLPGLPSRLVRGFLVDDWTNLSLIGRYGTIDTFEKLVSYLLTGFSGPTGRPVSHASFLLDSNTWPAPAESFIVTNILLHLLNGTLLASALWQLALRLDWEKRQAAWVCVVSAGLWLLHPLWVSTTLYVVQRMTLLAATFVFAA